MAQSILIVRSASANDALVRLQSDAIIAGSRTLEDVHVSLLKVNELTTLPVELSQFDVLVFHYSDLLAADFIVRIRSSIRTKVVCLGSDIYSFRQYINLVSLVDLMLMPTDVHAQILRAGVSIPVKVLPEGIDPVVNGHVAEGYSNRPRLRRICWFGYAESFTKSMASVVPALSNMSRCGLIDQVALITNPPPLMSLPFEVLPYDTKSFSTNMQRFDYTVLSHLPLDLHVNTLIKSPNKAVTALLLGVIPLASRTPSYEKLYRTLGIDRFLYGSSAEFTELVTSLNPREDSAFLDEAQVIPQLIERFSPEAVAKVFVRQAKELAASERVPMMKGDWPGEGNVQLNLGAHLKDLIPSVRRALGRRLLKTQVVFRRGVK